MFWISELLILLRHSRQTISQLRSPSSMNPRIFSRESLGICFLLSGWLTRRIISKELDFDNLVQVKPDSHLGWTLPSVEHSSINFEYFFQDCLQAKCSYRASISSAEPPARVFCPKRIWRSSSLKSPATTKAAVSPDEELNLIIFEHSAIVDYI